MSLLSEAFAGANNRVWRGDESMWGLFKEDPWRILIGMDPFGTLVNNKIFDRDDKPIHAFDGGSTDEQRQQAIDRGIDPGPNDTAESIAQMISLSMLGGGDSTGGLTGLDAANIGGGLLGGGQPQQNNTAHLQALELERRKRAQSRGLLGA